MITAVISVLSTLAGALIGFWGTMKTSRSHLFYASASNLKHSFLEVLVLLRQPKETFIDLYVIEIMEKSFYKHELAVVEFRYSLPASNRESFDAAWRNYYESDRAGEDKLTKKYFGRPNWQHEALANIEAILKFTERDPFWLWGKNLLGKDS
ncbi:MAG: hypothetical protein A4E70_01799 [Syntrophus sp. PtaU1.Bin005]|nr:MAG: hypothetical protein A4E70_01799 [Syntrophus sp. PtaU1.Bin005]